MKKLGLFVLLVFGFSMQANAGILLEPYLGYQMGGYDWGSTGEGDVTGVGFGARVGVTFPMLFIAADAQMSPGLSVEPDAGGEVDSDVTSYGVVVGADVSMMRLWAGYYIASTMEWDMTGSPEYDGTGFKLGLGYSIMPHVSINAEYVMMTYDEIDGVSFTPKLETNALFVSLSAPFTF